jgi:hypothetical protein
LVSGFSTWGFQVARETNDELRAIKAEPSEGFDIGAVLVIARRSFLKLLLIYLDYWNVFIVKRTLSMRIILSQHELLIEQLFLRCLISHLSHLVYYQRAWKWVRGNEVGGVEVDFCVIGEAPDRGKFFNQPLT